MKKDDIALVGLCVLSVIVIATIIKQTQINRYQSNLDNQMITFYEAASEKLGINILSMPKSLESEK
jgi:hypothetical protein